MKRKVFDYIIAISIILGLFFCIFSDMSIFVTESGSANKHSLASEQNEQAIESYGIEVPYIWDETVYENHIICANIDVPDVIREKGFQKATAVQNETQFEEFNNILKEYELKEEALPDGSTRYVGLYESYLYIYPEVVLFTSENSSYINMAYRDVTFMDSYNADKYPVDLELEEFSLQECDAKLDTIMKDMGIGDDVTVFQRSLDYKTMEQEAIELYKDGTEDKPNYEWSVEDDSYYCKISPLCNDIPVIPNDSFIYWTNIIYDSMYTIILREDRIVNMYCYQVFDISYEDEYEEMVEFSQIIQKYKDIAVDVPKEQKIQITDITLRVRPIKNDEGSYDLVPMWIFYGTQDIEGFLPYPYVVIFNALTGEVML